MTRREGNHKFRFIGHGIMLALCYLLEVTPKALPTFWGTLPMLVVGAVVCIAMFERDFAGAIVGLTGGLLLDITFMHAPGFNAIVLMIIGCAAGLMVNHLMRNTLSSTLLLSGGAVLVYSIAYWIFFCALAGTERAGYYFFRQLLLSCVYTMIYIIPIYFITRRLMKSAKY